MLEVFKRLLKATTRRRSTREQTREEEPERIRRFVEDMNRLAEFAAGEAGQQTCWGEYVNTIRHYAKPETCKAYDFLFHDFVLPNVPDFERSHGLDFGCWVGLSTLMLARLGPASVTGVDVVDRFLRAGQAFAEHLGLANVDFRLIRGAPRAPMPVEPGSVDWVLANDVFSFANPQCHDFLVRDVARVLKPGGRFLLSDGNNPRHEETVQRLRATWPRYEDGSGAPDAPDGTYFRMRKAYIQERFPDLDSQRVERCARETAYTGGARRSTLTWKP